MGKSKLRKERQYANHVMEYPIDLEQCKKSNLMITGVNQVGKTRLAMALCDILMSEGFQCIVIDTVGHWKNRSSIPFYYDVSEVSMSYIIPKTSMIFDLSELMPIFQKQWLEAFLHDLWKSRKHEQPNNYCMICLEESHLYMRRLDSMASQSLMRICSVAANEPYHIRVMAISPSFTGLHSEFRRLSQLRYHFRIGRESNTKRRFSGIYNKDWTRIALELDVGCLIYYNNGKMDIWKIPLFHTRRLPQKYVEPKEPIPEKKGLIQRIMRTISGKSKEVYDYEQEYQREQEQNREDIDFLEEW